MVVVPGAALPLYRQFATPHREIVAQEDLLPFRIWRLPTALRHLSGVIRGLSRPLYVNAMLTPIRGWMIQQMLKIEVSRRAQEAAIMHVDSDVFFVRRFSADMAFANGKPQFFTVSGQTANPMHSRWNAVCAKLLEADIPESFHNHYIENCVLWSPDMVRSMVARTEDVTGRSIHDTICALRTISEYYLYGLFLDIVEGHGAVSPTDVSYCNSYWPASDDVSYDFKAHMAQMNPKHVALAIQSTYPLPSPEREAIYVQASDWCRNATA
jgi:hypothetical protein